MANWTPYYINSGKRAQARYLTHGKESSLYKASPCFVQREGRAPHPALCLSHSNCLLLHLAPASWSPPQIPNHASFIQNSKHYSMSFKPPRYSQSGLVQVLRVKGSPPEFLILRDGSHLGLPPCQSGVCCLIWGRFALHDRCIGPTRLLQLSLFRPTLRPAKAETSTTVAFRLANKLPK